MGESDNVLTKFHDLLVYLVPQLAKFPREQKFLLADRIETKVLDAQEQCLRAYYSKRKIEHLHEANLCLEIARHLVRLAHTLRYLSTQRYGTLSQRIDEVGRMIGGWLRSLGKRETGT